MKHPVITILGWLSNLKIKVYDFYIIMYFYIGANYAKQSQFYAFFALKSRFHEKTNPIQTQFNPKQTQFKANLVKGQKMLEFALDVCSLASLSGAWIRSLSVILIMLLADFTTLKGANFKRYRAKIANHESAQLKL
jgi:hypothetical protein